MRLIDGVTFEHFGHLAEAEQAYRAAIDPARPAAADDAIKPEQTAKFPAAVRTWAQVRLATMQMKADRAPEVDACAMAARGAPAGLIDALNGLYGYANQIWTPEKLCGLVP